MSSIDFEGQHFKVLKDCAAQDARSIDDVGGKYARRFAEGLPGVQADKLPDRMVSRSDVFRFAADMNLSTETVSAAVMAWGGMHMGHRNALFGSSDKSWVHVCDQIRLGEHDRRSAYEALAALQAQRKLPGLGPAYFTKLIYFFLPPSVRGQYPGYIMDQWASCSINLLAETDIVLMDQTAIWARRKANGSGLEKRWTYTVSNFNTARNYTRFCEIMDSVAQRLGLSPDQVDRLVLSDARPRPAKWRQYVIDQRRAL